MKYKIFVIVFIMLIGCSKESIEIDCPEVEMLQWLKKANPKHDAKLALKDGDFRYKAVYGIGVSVPGIDINPWDLDYVAIEGTSDAICSESHSKLIGIAYHYASEYNRVIKESAKNAL